MPLPLIAASAERQTLDEIRDWHGGIVEALIYHVASLQRAIREGSPVSKRFVGMTEAEVDAHYDAQRRELDRLTMLNLVASAEATITDDFFRRVRNHLKDPLSREYQTWHKSLSAADQLRPPFDGNGILSVLKEANVLDNNLVGQYRECRRARHWVGHGRRWDRPVEVDRFDPDAVYTRAAALLNALPA